MISLENSRLYLSIAPLAHTLVCWRQLNALKGRAFRGANLGKRYVFQAPMERNTAHDRCIGTLAPNLPCSGGLTVPDIGGVLARYPISMEFDHKERAATTAFPSVILHFRACPTVRFLVWLHRRRYRAKSFLPRRYKVYRAVLARSRSVGVYGPLCSTEQNVF